MEFTVSRAYLPKEWGKIEEFFKEQFFKQLCVVKMFGLEDESPPDLPDDPEFVVKAEDAQGQLIGVAFNTTNPTDLWSLDKSDRERQLVEFFRFFEADLVEMEGSLELWLVGVAEGWGRRGVGRRLVEESARLAAASGFRLLTVTCLNEPMASLARRLGCRELSRLRYQDYPHLSGRQVKLQPTPLYHTIYYYVKHLRQLSSKISSKQNKK